MLGVESYRASLYSSTFVVNEKARLGLPVGRFTALAADIILHGVRRMSPAEELGSELRPRR